MQIRGTTTNGLDGLKELNSAQKEIELEDISILYTTEKEEQNRSNFAETFKTVSVRDYDTGNKFLSGLQDNKETLSKDLGLSSEEYDSLACIVLALSSQETGFGKEVGYDGENTGIGGFFRKTGKLFLSLFGGDSASSGLTQMKIHDFMNGDKLTDEQKEILKTYGIESNHAGRNNLYDNPDKSAVATMVVLSSIYENYDNYKDVLKTEHERIGNEISSAPNELEKFEEKGNELLTNIYEVYANASDSQKIEIRNKFKSLLLAQNDSKKGDNVSDEYNEEIQLENLNKILADNDSDFKLDENSLTYIRYALTTEGNEMSPAEYCAYGWNKGTGETGMQLDRMLAEKIGTILSNPEDFDYDQFTTNVATLAEKYAEQSVGEDGLDYINQAFLDENG